MKDKGSLRQQFLELLKKQENTETEAKSRQIQKKLFSLEAFKKAKTILFYVSLPGEVNTFEMIIKAFEMNKRICVPVMVRDQRQMIPTLINTLADLEKGSYGILEPRMDSSLQVPLEELDMVIVPGVAFDKSNNRLGRGVGYYDRFLCRLPKSVTTIGLAFDVQLTENLPIEEHDVPLSSIISN